MVPAWKACLAKAETRVFRAQWSLTFMFFKGRLASVTRKLTADHDSPTVAALPFVSI